MLCQVLELSSAQRGSHLLLTVEAADCSILQLLDQSAAFNSVDETCLLRRGLFVLLFLTATVLVYENHHPLKHFSQHPPRV